MKFEGKKFEIEPVGEVHIWLYTPAAFNRIEAKLQEMNVRGGHSHTIEQADLTSLFKSGVPVMQPNPARYKTAVLYKVTWRPATRTIRNFYKSEPDSRFYNWFRFIGYKTRTSEPVTPDSLPLDRGEWPPMIDVATHLTVLPKSVKLVADGGTVRIVDDPDWNPDAHDSSRD